MKLVGIVGMTGMMVLMAGCGASATETPAQAPVGTTSLSSAQVATWDPDEVVAEFNAERGKPGRAQWDPDQVAAEFKAQSAREAEQARTWGVPQQLP